MRATASFRRDSALTPLLLALALAGAAAAQDTPPAPAAAEAADAAPPADDPARARWNEEVNVTAGRAETRVGETAARVLVLDAEALRLSAAFTLDDALRQVPGFTLFRRTGSRAANPTAQGASLRGVGPSGASRTLVLVDGVPANDAFGGWVYWSRLPRIALERVEVMEGGASDLYGSDALGGVVQALGRTDTPAVSVEASAGNQGTGRTAFYGALGAAKWSARAWGEAATTDGYVLVEPESAGPVDTPAGARHLTGTLHMERRLSAASTAFLRASGLGESRTNGTPLQVNDTDWREAAAGADWTPAGRGRIALRTWYGSESYHQTFSAVAAGRASESLTRIQRVPSETWGVTAQWSRPVGARTALVAGADGRRVLGRSDETPVVAGVPGALTSSGGRADDWAGFANARTAVGARVILAAGLRVDEWSRGARGQTVASPKVSLVARGPARVELRAAAYTAFRAPTLNELYRSFRVGDVLTRANAELTPERLAGGELGLWWSPHSQRVRLRATGFLARIDDPVANVTVSVTPGLTIRERRNLGRTRNDGVGADAELEIARGVRAGLGYAYTHARVVAFEPAPDLVGNDVPQVPRHQLTAQLQAARGPFALALQARYGSRQFEDDQNLLVLPAYVNLDVRMSRRLGARAEAFLTLENVTGERAVVGLTPVQTLGSPRLAQAGVRFDWSGAKRPTAP